MSEEIYQVAHLTSFLDSPNEEIEGLEPAIARAVEMAEERDEREVHYSQPFGVWHKRRSDCVAIVYAGRVFMP